MQVYIILIFTTMLSLFAKEERNKKCVHFMFLLSFYSNTDGFIPKRPFSACNKATLIELAALENIQIHILKELLNNKDHTDGLSTRFIFLHKFREFLKEHVPGNIRTTLVSKKN